LFIGDSNFDKITVGTGKGTVGGSTPGVKIRAPLFEHIVPESCSSYRNVVLMCGTNELKPAHKESGKPERGVIDIYKEYKGIVEDIRHCNPRGNIIICPVLPTRDGNINSRVMDFNRLIFDDLARCPLNVEVVSGFDDFLDRCDGLLSKVLFEKHSNTDVLHINGRGCALLVKCIKRTIFGIKKRRNVGSKVAAGRGWPDLVRTQPHLSQY
jgi:hypothetical protein